MTKSIDHTFQEHGLPTKVQLVLHHADGYVYTADVFQKMHDATRITLEIIPSYDSGWLDNKCVFPLVSERLCIEVLYRR